MQAIHRFICLLAIWAEIYVAFAGRLWTQVQCVLCALCVKGCIIDQLKVLSNDTGGGVCVVSIDRPLIRQHFRQF